MKKYLLLLPCYCLMACGLSQPTEPTLEVLMYTLPKAPVGAEGNATPKYYDINLRSIELFFINNPDSFRMDVSNLSAFRIVNREQIVLASSLSGYEDTEIAGVQIEFEPSFLAAGKYEAGHELSFSSATLEHIQPLLLEKNRSLKLDIQLNWLNTVSADETTKTESLIAPDIVVQLKSVRI